jgi:nickel-dependent lactate racemase
MQKMKPFAVDWNGERRTLCLPAANLASELRMTDFPPVADPWQAMRQALENPIGRPPLAEMLRPRSKVALLTGDRFTDELLGARGGLGHPLLDYLNGLGVRDEDVTLVYAPGSHPTPHWRERMGPSLLQRIKAVCHNCFDEQSLSYLGVTSRCTPLWVNKTVAEADFRLAIGEISPNVHGGWCGGGKIILPGVAGWDSIEHNHFGVVNQLNTLGLVDGNHMRQDMEEAAGMLGLEMKLDILVDRHARVVDAYAGHFVAEHRAALANRARDIWMTKMEPADIYVLYPGESSDKYLSSAFFIRIEGAELGAQPDGIIILALSAVGGWAPVPISGHQGDLSPAESAALFKAGTQEIARQMVRKAVNIRTASILYTARRVLERRKVFLVCDGIDPREAAEFGFQYCTRSFDEALALAVAEKGRAARMAVNVINDPVVNPPGRPVSWRAMPWREG